MNALDIKPATLFLWNACGADRAILESEQCPEPERVRFAALGLLLVVGAGVNVASGFLTADFVFFSGNLFDGGFLVGVTKLVSSALYAVLWSAFMFTLFRLTIGLAGRHSDRLSLRVADLLRAVGIAGLTFALAIATAAPFQVVLVERGSKTEALALSQLKSLQAARRLDAQSIDSLTAPLVQFQAEGSKLPPVKLAPECTSVMTCQTFYSEAGRATRTSSARSSSPGEELDIVTTRVMQDRFDRLAEDRAVGGFFSRIFLAYDSNPLFSWTILLATWLLLVLAPAIRLFTDRGAYDFLVDQRKRRWLSEHGIEVDAHTIFSVSGEPIHLPAFHGARRVLRERQAEIAAHLKEDLSAQDRAIRAGAAVRPDDSRNE